MGVSHFAVPSCFAPSLSCASTLLRSRLRVVRHPCIRCCTTLSSTSSDTPTPTPTSVKKRVVSGVQPTGSIHLGNYFGAIKNWVALQNSYDTLFFIVDLHAITLSYDVQQLSKATRATAAIYLACGVDPSKASVFVQSHVRAHVELMWLLSSTTPIGWLNKMIQFKEKSRKAGDEEVGVALLTYPVLMASDILLYQSDFVPVGEDQKQHLELTRDLAERVPEPLIPPAGARIMSLTDGLSKMSKSAPSDQSRINILDPKDGLAVWEGDSRSLKNLGGLTLILHVFCSSSPSLVVYPIGDLSWYMCIDVRLEFLDKDSEAWMKSGKKVNSTCQGERNLENLSAESNATGVADWERLSTKGGHGGASTIVVLMVGDLLAKPILDCLLGCCKL
ncbi:Tryptophan-tRNA ligase [Sesbania bispinosa]|nr:Tryptophan-tRNA ligase [Sesbania bispinosa]